MSTFPTLELTFRNVAGNPWEGEAVARYDDEPSKPFAVREGLTSKQREHLRWYVEQYLDFPEGGYVTSASGSVRVQRSTGVPAPAGAAIQGSSVLEGV